LNTYFKEQEVEEENNEIYLIFNEIQQFLKENNIEQVFYLLDF